MRLGVGVLAVAMAGIGCGATVVDGVGTTADAGADVTASAPSCGDTATSGANCGRCGRDCLGGGCVSGRCVPVLLPSGDVVSVDAVDVFAATSNGIVRFDKLARDFDAPTTTVFTDAKFGRPVARSGDEFFWAYAGDVTGRTPTLVPNTGAIRGWSQAGGVRSIAAPVDSPRALAVDADTVYWSTANGLFAAPRIGGGPPRRIVANAMIEALAVGDRDVYFGGFDEFVHRVPKDAVDGTPAVVAQTGGAHRIVVSDGVLFVGGGGLSGVDVQTGAITRISVETVAEMVLDGADILYVEPAVGLWRVPANASSAAERLYSGRITHVVADPVAYWFTHEGGAIRRLAR